MLSHSKLGSLHSKEFTPLWVGSFQERVSSFSCWTCTLHGGNVLCAVLQKLGPSLHPKNWGEQMVVSQTQL